MAYNYSYKFTEKAESDLEEILQYISEDLSNPSAAGNLAVSFFNAIDNVLAYPLSGKLVVNEYLSDKSIRRLLIENYTLYYRIDDDNKIIYIVRFIYSKRNFDEIAKTI